MGGALVQHMCASQYIEVEELTTYLIPIVCQQSVNKPKGGILSMLI
jgi:hypothetical protein